ncbi:MAG TPA: porin family protein [Flavobacterium sp.]|nr:porin family protein [Flavobacterium sp.]
MRKIILSALAVFAFSFANAQQTKFGIIAGADFATGKVELEGFNVTENTTAFFGGFFADITASEKFHVQPELVIVTAEGGSQLQLPILVKYYLADKVSILAGPDLLFDLEEKTEGLKTFGVGIDFGAAYDINEHFMIEAKYNLGLTNFIEDAPSGYSAKINGFFLGLGYKF